MYSIKTLIQVLCFNFVVKNCNSRLLTNESSVKTYRKINGCVLPEHPEFGHWTIYQQTFQHSPGQTVSLGTILNISCRDNRKLNGDTTIVCIGGEWTKQIGQCMKTCPPRYSTPIMTVTCTHNERKLESCTEAFDGTLARFQCADFYEDESLKRHPIHVCSNGKWSHSLPECVPSCGKKTAKENPTLIIGGDNATKGDYPWQAALYDATDKELLCGGSLLNQRVILTAAHCVTDDRNNKLIPKENFIAAVGKYYRNYHDSRDFDTAQFSPIFHIYVSKQYKGNTQNFFGDVALLVTKKTFVLSGRVQPVCVDWSFKYHQALLDPTRTPHGYVSGWGYTAEHKTPAENLKELKTPLITEEECLKKIPEDFEKYLTDDKLCAGFLDRGTSVCKGDSGGGLVVKYDNRYYIVGIVSVAPQALTEQGGCNSQQYTLYTRVSYYVQTFILEKEAKYRPTFCGNDAGCETDVPEETAVTPTPITTDAEVSRDKCLLPEHPRFGRWSVFGTTALFSPGMEVPSGTVLRIYCENRFKIDGPEIILCEKGKWIGEMGQCLKTCPSVYSTNTTEITCSYHGKVLKDCSDPLDGTLAKSNCAPFYENLQLNKNPIRLCSDGAWDLAIPECVPACGQKSVTATKLIINGSVVNKGEYPWQVAIYTKADKVLICSGSLISRRVILTAAHCVTDFNGNKLPTENYVVAVGKYYNKYNDSRDSEAQFSELESISIPEEYSAEIQNYLGDIAILVTKITFKFSQRVQPVCLDTGDVVSPEANELGVVTGWGYTVEYEKPSDVLRELKIPSVSLAECRKNLPEDYLQFLTFDKMCAGYLNKSTSVCSGDAGAGLMFKHDGRYYITGILSLGPQAPTEKGGCDSQQYALYTKVSKYMNRFIIQKLAEANSNEFY